MHGNHPLAILFLLPLNFLFAHFGAVFGDAQDLVLALHSGIILLDSEDKRNARVQTWVAACRPSNLTPILSLQSYLGLI